MERLYIGSVKGDCGDAPFAPEAESRSSIRPVGKFMLDLKETIEAVCRNATLHKPYEFKVVTLEAAKEVTKPNSRFRVTRSNANTFHVELIDQSSASSVPVDLGQAHAIAGVISGTAFAKTQYSNVTESWLFHILYDVKKRQFDYMQAGQLIKKLVDSAPCMVCGVVLPVRNLTIDHQRPQSGGEIEAVLKTFRAFGLTLEGPKGPKGQAILRHVTTGAGMAPAMPQAGRAALVGTSPTNRYSLNAKGVILYSFISAAGKTAELRSQCMHGLLNLRPVCQTCNSSRGSPLKF